jgi:DNA helicase HerA-like ATPase
MSEDTTDLVLTEGFSSVLEVFGETMPQLLLSLLERRYLTDFKSALWRIIPTPADAARPLLREIRAMGRAQPGEDRGGAMPHVLTATHGQGHAVVTVVHGDGSRHRIFIGGRRLAGTAHGSTQDFLEGQASLLRSHVAGLDLTAAAPLAGIPELSAFLHAAPALAVVTGIPAPRGREGAAAFQNIDRLIGAVGDRRYALVLVAEPLGPLELDEAVDQCRRLKSEVHALTHRNVSQSQQEGTSSSTTFQERGPEGSDLSKYLVALIEFANVAGVVIPHLKMVQKTAETAVKVAETAKAAKTAVKVAETAKTAVKVAETAKTAASTVSGVAGSALRVGNVWTAPQAPTSTQTAASTQTATSEGQSRSWSADLLNANAEACEQLLQRHIDRLQAARSSGWWRSTIYVAADGDGTLEAVTSALRAISSGEATALDPMRVLRIDTSTVRSAMVRGQTLTLKPVSDDHGHPFGPPFDALATCVTSDELAVLTALPRRDVPGLPMRDVSEFALSAPPPVNGGVRLGSLRDSLGRDLQQVTVTAEALNRHVFITGMTGYGKTTTAKNLLVEAYQALGVPFLVIEPAKAEYRQLTGHPGLRGRLRVYSIGSDAPLPLRLNPFVPIESVPLSRHIDLLKAVFNAAFPMFAGMSQVMEEAMLEVYSERGWNLYTSANDMLGPRPAADDLSALIPSIGDLYNKIEIVLDRKQYGREIHQNLGAALRSRLQSLVVGTKGMALDTRRSVPATDLFTEPCVIELRNLGDDEEKSFVMALLLCQLYEYAESRQVGRQQLQHLTLIEEAHRLLRSARPPSGAETPDAQAKAVGMFTDMLAEMRAYGEGFIVADQIPTKLAPETVKNSNLKIIHRLVSVDDRAVVAGAINLTEAQTRHLANLAPGEAVIHDEQIGSAVLVKMSDPPSASSAPAATPHDRSYLRRNGACRYCPAPCSFLHLTTARAASTDTELLPFFRALMIASPETAWEHWSAWRHSWQDAGRAYCASSQAAFRWLGQLAGQTATADQLLRQDRAARSIGSLCASWSTATEWSEAAKTAASKVQLKLASTIGARPPRELPGCEHCPVRCRALPVTGPLLPSVGSRIAACATRDTSVPQRLRELTRIAEDAFPALLDLPEHRSALIYCMVTNATGTESAPTQPDAQATATGRLEELLTALREDAVGV